MVDDIVTYASCLGHNDFSNFEHCAKIELGIVFADLGECGTDIVALLVEQFFKELARHHEVFFGGRLCIASSYFVGVFIFHVSCFLDILFCRSGGNGGVCRFRIALLSENSAACFWLRRRSWVPVA